MRLKAFAIVAGLILFIALPGASAADTDLSKEAVLPALLKVPTHAMITKNNDPDGHKTAEWVSQLMESKERRAKVELELIKKALEKEEAARSAEEKERLRRQENYRRSFGDAPATADAFGKRKGSRVKLDFQVLEINSYRVASEVCAAQQTFAAAAADYLAKLDRDGDGKLSAEEFRDAAALYFGSTKLFANIDSNNDGMMSEEEMTVSASLPASVATAVRQGRALVETKKVKFTEYDRNSNSVLDVDEYKALVMAYVEAGQRANTDGAYYKQLAETLENSRAAAALRYSDIAVGQ